MNNLRHLLWIMSDTTKAVGDRYLKMANAIRSMPAIH